MIIPVHHKFQLPVILYSKFYYHPDKYTNKYDNIHKNEVKESNGQTNKILIFRLTLKFCLNLFLIILLAPSLLIENEVFLYFSRVRPYVRTRHLAFDR